MHAASVATNLATGWYHSLIIKSDGSLWAAGDNEFGQLGDGTNQTTNKLEQIVPGGVSAVSAGGGHSLFIKSDGSLWAMGYNAYGQLGDGTTNNSNIPEEIVPSGVIAIAGGDYHSLFLKADGSLWAMGDNLFGQLGDGTDSNVLIPEQIVPSGVTAMSAGITHSLFIKSDGSLWAMGDNSFGEFGDGTINSTNRPRMILASGVTAVAAGAFYSLFLKNDGSLWATGDEWYGGLGDGANGINVYTNIPEEIVQSNVVAIAAGEHHSHFVMSDGSLWAMGANDYGGLGDGKTNNVDRPELIVSNGVVAVVAGFYQDSWFLKSDGSFWATGYGNLGGLGDGFYGILLLPKQIFPPVPPVLSTPTIQSFSYPPPGQTNLVIAATCFQGGRYCLLASTNISLPVGLWTPVRTNSAGFRGKNNFNASLPDPRNSNLPQQFYRLLAQ